MPPQYHGIVPPLVTPLLDYDTLDVSGLEKLLEHVIAGGVQGLFILGTTGEAPSLSYRLRKELIRRVCEQVNQRVPVLVGITDTAVVESIELARFAAEAGSDALVLTAPYYFPAGQTELFGYVTRLVGKLPLPLMLYNMPGLTKIWFETETVKKLTEIDQIVGIKDSSGDLEYFRNLLTLKSQRPDWSFLIGTESLLSQAVDLGGEGAVAGGANVFPALFTQCYQAAVAGDRQRVAELNSTIARFQKIYEIGKYASRHIKATKCALSLLGICDDFMAEPFDRFHPADREKVREILEPLCSDVDSVTSLPMSTR